MAPRRPGKYDHLLPKLKPLPPQDINQQQKVDEAKQALRMCVVCDGSGKRRSCSCDATLAKTHPMDHAPDCLFQTAEVCDACNGTGRRTLTASMLAALYTTSRATQERLEEAVKEVGVDIEALTQMLTDSQLRGDADWGAYGASDRTVKLTNGDTVRMQPEVFAMPRDKAAFRMWCYQQHFEDQMELPDKKTQDMVKLRLLNGAPEPPGIDVYIRTRIVYTKMKAGKGNPDIQSQGTSEDISIEAF